MDKNIQNVWLESQLIAVLYYASYPTIKGTCKIHGNVRFYPIVSLLAAHATGQALLRLAMLIVQNTPAIQKALALF